MNKRARGAEAQEKTNAPPLRSGKPQKADTSVLATRKNRHWHLGGSFMLT